MTEPLNDLERRVGEKWATVVGARSPDLTDLLNLSDLQDATEWPTDIPQLPREQWVRHPNARTVALLHAEHLLEHADTLTEVQWLWLNWTMIYGGKTRMV